MKPVTKTLLLLTGVALLFAFIGFEGGLAVSGNSIPAIILILGFAALVVWYLRGAARRELTMEKVIEFLVGWWRRVAHEDLSREDWQGRRGYAGSLPFFAFTVYRRAGYKTGRPMCIVVDPGKGRPDVIRFNDNPTPEEERDPFLIVKDYLHITPVPTPLYPKYLDYIPPFGRKRRSGVTVNVGGHVGTGQEPAAPQSEGDD